jgi:hypothetical protein
MVACSFSTLDYPADIGTARPPLDTPEDQLYTSVKPNFLASGLSENARHRPFINRRFSLSEGISRESAAPARPEPQVAIRFGCLPRIGVEGARPVRSGRQATRQAVRFADAGSAASADHNQSGAGRGEVDHVDSSC